MITKRAFEWPKLSFSTGTFIHVFFNILWKYPFHTPTHEISTDQDNPQTSAPFGRKERSSSVIVSLFDIFGYSVDFFRVWYNYSDIIVIVWLVELR